MKASREEIRHAELVIAMTLQANHIERAAGVSALANMLIAAFIEARADSDSDEAIVVAELRRLAGRLTAMADAPTPADMKLLAHQLADSSTH